MRIYCIAKGMTRRKSTHLVWTHFNLQLTKFADVNLVIQKADY